MATSSKAGQEVAKDTQIKPIVQDKEQENEKTVDPLQGSKLYQEDKQALIEPEQPKSQQIVAPEDVKKDEKEGEKELEETARG